MCVVGKINQEKGALKIKPSQTKESAPGTQALNTATALPSVSG